MARPTAGLSGRIGRMDLRNSLRRVKDTRNFQIDKMGRFANRFFQVILCFIMWYFISQLGASASKNLNAVYLTPSALNLFWFLTIMGPIVSVWNAAMYMAPWFSKAWSSRRIIIVEGVGDACFSVIWTIAFVYGATIAGKNCSCAVTRSCLLSDVMAVCDKTNWLIAFSCFISVSWIAALVYDVHAFYKGVIKTEDIDPETLLEVHRSARMGRA
jgi:hypothetical protein